MRPKRPPQPPKICQKCGREFYFGATKSLSVAQWAARKYCSLKCNAAACPPPKAKPKPLADRFWPKVDRRGDDECWPWLASKDEHGYGMIHVKNTGHSRHKGDHGGGHSTRSHIVAFKLSGGVLLPGQIVCHHCDNPPCCNPKHLYAGNQLMNVGDRERRGRSNRRMGEEHGQAKLTEEVVRDIRGREWKRGLARKLGDVFGVDRNTIYAVRNRKTWRHVE